MCDIHCLEICVSVPGERSLKASVGLLKARVGGMFQKHSESWAQMEVPGAKDLTLLPSQANPVY